MALGPNMKPDPPDSSNHPIMVFKVDLSSPLKKTPWRLTIAIMPCWTVIFGDFDKGVEGTLKEKYPERLRYGYHSNREIIGWIGSEYTTGRFEPNVNPFWKELVRFRVDFPYDKVGSG